MKRNTILNKKSVLYRTLARALSMKRPHKSVGETMLIEWLIDNLPINTAYTLDSVGNLHVDTRKGKTNRTLFIAHVDTVHAAEGPNKIRKTYTKWYASGSQLGADDGAGVALLMHLLCGGVPAYYIFSVGEERGGIGASHIADEFEDLLREFDRAIAFDRRGTTSVISHQGYGRCCSDKFAEALSEALCDDNLMYIPDDTGVYTDTAEFVDVIPECTNISCGYQFEHSDKEELDLSHLQHLANRILQIDWDSLPIDRDPTVPDYKDYGYKWNAVSYPTSYPASPSATSVSAPWSFHEDEVHWEREYLREAVYDALVGMPDELVELMCESVYPEDPNLAKRYIDKTKLTEDVLEETLQRVNTYDKDTVLCALYDTVYAGV